MVTVYKESRKLSIRISVFFYIYRITFPLFIKTEPAHVIGRPL